ncbi:GNAT family N-acetyltransferase [Dysgonomonas macrotermitis]|uniref:Ribosomal-protein-serine acetyltransferase n=1 Tax=Dysgonomonas macrotermitis TaxID=1346286 RepID=A0A1M4XWE9_9BACT|nr:GNAT family protein [Dysgonomonas macrotermitis]SHE97755.1 ribosomal-protein-serine acetyltransferase [Dysgonomonas macrotermitis]
MKINVTSDILLRPVSLEMVHDIFNILNTQRNHLRRWLPFVDSTLEENDTRTYIQSVKDEPKTQFGIYYSNEFVGLIGFNNIDVQNQKCEIGYWLSEKFEGRGIVTRSVKALLKYAFLEMKMNKVVIKAATENRKSRKVAQRLDFTLEGMERDGELLVDNQYTDLAIYGLLKNEFILSDFTEKG